ncbi:hypothetical protein A3I57_01725 [Candidatus Beckwithbacteria bacterium RIFCSPLOWO2_02_FULL_47_23]|uniref:SIMPL domain-containing protein n=3 Tax=Candidatus Beckwithiibacteriota TaxID=1752726 RepID=A0A1F5E3A1_9BACT|nr:MAG: hypothetical protein A3E73_01280 [Candidatus Beckwithbacteria bacterium RIFCSPHIGHO2_12_FULL_47_17]OGD61875.1 MAG: hypothetical protein A3I57_01725 [Candidatus Beckwithbacteria bacterium RIFCSPLOWO2_02_FULL_47_23]
MKIIFGLIFLLAALVGSWFTPWSQPRAMITVTGEAKQAVANQIANFNVSVTQTNKDKQVAVEAVNQEMDKIIKTVKELGIEAKDITTQNVSVFEIKKQWQASNSLEIILRNIDQAQALADLLQGFPLAQVSGPGFSVDDTNAADADLLTEAVADAREKAAKVAAASGRKLGKVITVSETGSYPIYRGLEAASSRDAVSTPIEPGSSQMSQIVTVVFELK